MKYIKIGVSEKIIYYTARMKKKSRKKEKERERQIPTHKIKIKTRKTLVSVFDCDLWLFESKTLLESCTNARDK